MARRRKSKVVGPKGSQTQERFPLKQWNHSANFESLAEATTVRVYSESIIDDQVKATDSTDSEMIEVQREVLDSPSSAAENMPKIFNMIGRLQRTVDEVLRNQNQVLRSLGMRNKQPAQVVKGAKKRVIHKDNARCVMCSGDHRTSLCVKYPDHVSKCHRLIALRRCLKCVGKKCDGFFGRCKKAYSACRLCAERFPELSIQRHHPFVCPVRFPLKSNPVSVHEHRTSTSPSLHACSLEQDLRIKTEFEPESSTSEPDQPNWSRNRSHSQVLEGGFDRNHIRDAEKTLVHSDNRTWKVEPFSPSRI